MTRFMMIHEGVSAKTGGNPGNSSHLTRIAFQEFLGTQSSPLNEGDDFG
jgi:hypothetical protein